MSSIDEEDEKNTSGYDLPPITRNDSFLSPDQAQQREIDGNTPTRVLSSHSLVGEDFILSARPSLDFPTDIALSPFTPSEGTETPPLNLPDPVTPPPLRPLPSLPLPSPSPSPSSTSPSPSTFHRAARSQPQLLVPSSATTSSSLPGRMRPPRVPQISLQPSRSVQARHGRGLSNSDYSFLSALTDGTNDNITGNQNTALSVSSNITVPRRRTVSWDYNESVDRSFRPTDSSIRSTPASILQPILKEEFVAPPASIVTDLGSTVAVAASSRQSRTIQQGDEAVLSTSSIDERGFNHTRTLILPAHPVHLIHPGAAVAVAVADVGVDAITDNTQSVPIWNPVVARDTGSIFQPLDHSADPRTPTSGRMTSRPRVRQRPDSPEDPTKPYTINDVINTYPPEPPEETLLISRIETQPTSRNPSGLTPELPSESLIQYINHLSEDIQQEGNNARSLESTRSIEHPAINSFESITKKLLEASPNRRRVSSVTTNVTKHGRQATDAPMNAGEKMYEAAEAIFGQYADSTLDGENDEESPEHNSRRFSRRFKGTKSIPSLSWRPFRAFRKRTGADLAYFVEFLGPQRPNLRKEFFRLARFIMLPSLAIAAILFYLFENPPTGYNDPDNNDYESLARVGPKGNDNPASFSWWLIFCGVRQMITLELARFSQLMIIDFLTLRTKTFPKLLGPTLALLVAQAKGWPFILTFWAIWDFALLFGDNRFAHHWAYWQVWIKMFNETNPHGDITSGDKYGRVLALLLAAGIAMSVKRAVMGQLVGKRVVRNYRGDMARLIQKIIILSEVSHLAVQIDSKAQHPSSRRHKAIDDGRTKEWGMAVDVNLLASSGTQGDSFDYSDGFSGYSRSETKKFTATAQMEMMELLEEWEEPELQGTDDEAITVATILHFRRALEFISDDYPFSPAFGNVRTREECVKSAQMVFERLMAGETEPCLHFDVLCLLAKDSEGNIDRNTVKELIRVFRPNRNGQLSKLDFVKSVDSVFKSLRLLLASIQNSQQIDRAYETIVNVGFSICAAFVIMATFGVDIQALIFGAGTIIVSLAFMIGPTSSNYLEGILFVLARKPYDIGDMVNIDHVVAQSNIFGGESCWIIEKVDLFTTTARLGATRELATFSNGSLSMMRIKNLNRSEKPNVFLNLKFSLDSTLEQRLMFKRRITAFVKERPREWIKVIDFRSTRVETDLGFVEYVLILQHREKWQNLGAILTSRGDVFNFAVELQKVLHMKYKAPRVPIDIRRIETESIGKSQDSSGEVDIMDESKKER